MGLKRKGCGTENLFWTALTFTATLFISHTSKQYYYNNKAERISKMKQKTKLELKTEPNVMNHLISE